MPGYLVVKSNVESNVDARDVTNKGRVSTRGSGIVVNWPTLDRGRLVSFLGEKFPIFSAVLHNMSAIEAVSSILGSQRSLSIFQEILVQMDIGGINLHPDEEGNSSPGRNAALRGRQRFVQAVRLMVDCFRRGQDGQFGMSFEEATEILQGAWLMMPASGQAQLAPLLKSSGIVLGALLSTGALGISLECISVWESLLPVLGVDMAAINDIWTGNEYLLRPISEVELSIPLRYPDSEEAWQEVFMASFPYYSSKMARVLTAFAGFAPFVVARHVIIQRSGQGEQLCVLVNELILEILTIAEMINSILRYGGHNGIEEPISPAFTSKCFGFHDIGHPQTVAEFIRIAELIIQILSPSNLLKGERPRDQSSTLTDDIHPGGQASFFQDSQGFLRMLTAVDDSMVPDSTALLDLGYSPRASCSDITALLHQYMGPNDGEDWRRNISSLGRNVPSKQKKEGRKSSDKYNFQGNQPKESFLIPFLVSAQPLPDIVDSNGIPIFAPSLFDQLGAMVQGSSAIEATQGDYFVLSATIFVWLYRSHCATMNFHSGKQLLRIGEVTCYSQNTAALNGYRRKHAAMDIAALDRNFGQGDMLHKTLVWVQARRELVSGLTLRIEIIKDLMVNGCFPTAVFPMPRSMISTTSTTTPVFELLSLDSIEALHPSTALGAAIKDLFMVAGSTDSGTLCKLYDLFVDNTSCLGLNRPDYLVRGLIGAFMILCVSSTFEEEELIELIDPAYPGWTCNLHLEDAEAFIDLMTQLWILLFVDTPAEKRPLWVTTCISSADVGTINAMITDEEAHYRLLFRLYGWDRLGFLYRKGNPDGSRIKRNVTEPSNQEDVGLFTVLSILDSGLSWQQRVPANKGGLGSIRCLSKMSQDLKGWVSVVSSLVGARFYTACMQELVAHSPDISPVLSPKGLLRAPEYQPQLPARATSIVEQQLAEISKQLASLHHSQDEDARYKKGTTDALGNIVRKINDNNSGLEIVKASVKRIAETVTSEQANSKLVIERLQNSMEASRQQGIIINSLESKYTQLEDKRIEASDVTQTIMRRLTDVERQLMGIARGAPLSEASTDSSPATGDRQSVSFRDERPTLRSATTGSPNRVPMMEDKASTPLGDDRFHQHNPMLNRSFEGRSNHTNDMSVYMTSADRLSYGHRNGSPVTHAYEAGSPAALSQSREYGQQSEEKLRKDVKSNANVAGCYDGSASQCSIAYILITFGATLVTQCAWSMSPDALSSQMLKWSFWTYLSPDIKTQLGNDVYGEFMRIELEWSTIKIPVNKQILDMDGNFALCHASCNNSKVMEELGGAQLYMWRVFERMNIGDVPTDCFKDLVATCPLTTPELTTKMRKLHQYLTFFPGEVQQKCTEILEQIISKSVKTSDRIIQLWSSNLMPPGCLKELTVNGKLIPYPFGRSTGRSDDSNIRRFTCAAILSMLQLITSENDNATLRDATGSVEPKAAAAITPIDIKSVKFVNDARETGISSTVMKELQEMINTSTMKAVASALLLSSEQKSTIMANTANLPRREYSAGTPTSLMAPVGDVATKITSFSDRQHAAVTDPPNDYKISGGGRPSMSPSGSPNRMVRGAPRRPFPALQPGQCRWSQADCKFFNSERGCIYRHDGVQSSPTEFIRMLADNPIDHGELCSLEHAYCIESDDTQPLEERLAFVCRVLVEDNAVSSEDKALQLVVAKVSSMNKDSEEDHIHTFSK